MGWLSSVFGDKGLVGGVVDVLKSTGVMKDPEMELKVKQALMEYEIKVAELAAKELEAVNATMREEAKSEHWAQWLWRPVVGFTFSVMLINNYVLLPYFFKLGLQPITVPGEVWSAMLVILGVSAATRGLQKWQAEKSVDLR